MPTLKSTGRRFKDVLEKQGEQSVRNFFFEGELVEVENENGVTSVFVYDDTGARVINQMWCQLKGETNPTQVWAWMVSPYPGLPVWLFNFGQGYEIFRAKSLEGTGLEGEALQSVSFGPLFNEINKFSLVDRNFQPGMVIKSAQGGLWVQVYAVRYLRKDGVPATLMPQELDLTPFLPATSGTWAWVLVCIDPDTNALTAVTGDEYAAPNLLTRDLLDDIDASGLIPLDAVKLQDTSTEIGPENEFAFGRVLLQHRPKNNYDATAAPTVNDDDTEGYEVGSVWIDVSAGAVYFCSDASTGAAVWNATSVPTVYYQEIEDGGTPVTQRNAVNFIEGANIALTFNDDAGNDRTDITIAATAGGTNYQTVQDNGVDETQRGKLNLIEGSNITLTFSDNAGNDSTDVTIASTGGGGSATGTVWEPRAAPASPSGSDDEFADASGGVPGGFTEIDFDANTTVAENAQGLLITQTTHAGQSVAGIYKAIPDSNYTIWTRISQLAPYATVGGGTAFKIGLALYQDATDSTGDIFTWHLDFGSSAALGYQAIRYTAYNGSATNVFAVSGNQVSGLTSAYLRLRFDGTTYYCELSHDGMSIIRAGTVTAATLGYTPLHMGLAVNNVNTGSTVSGLAQFFRYVGSDVGVVPMSGRRVNYYA